MLKFTLNLLNQVTSSSVIVIVVGMIQLRHWVTISALNNNIKMMNEQAECCIASLSNAHSYILHKLEHPQRMSYIHVHGDPVVLPKPVLVNCGAKFSPPVHQRFLVRSDFFSCNVSGHDPTVIIHWLSIVLQPLKTSCIHHEQWHAWWHLTATLSKAEDSIHSWSRFSTGLSFIMLH